MAAEHQSLKILEVCNVAPPTDSPSQLSLSLTFFDLPWLRFPPVEYLFFYELSDTSSFFHTILPKLKSSLSLVLRHYTPLAGNFTWPQDSDKPTIEFTACDGVLFTVAESDAEFYHLSSNSFREASEYSSLIPEFPSSHEQTVVMTLQVTVFQKGGFSIGIVTHHALLDGRSSITFVKSWAHICKLHQGSSSPTVELLPLHDRTMVKDSRGLEALYLNALLNLGGPDNRSLMIWDSKTQPSSIRATFELTPQNLQNLKLFLSNHQKQPIQFSSFTLMTALTWVCLEKAEDTDDRELKTCVMITIDARSRLEPPVPSTYFGNCVVARPATAKREALVGENGIIVAAEAITEATKDLSGRILEVVEQQISWANSVNTTGNVISCVNTIGKLFGISGSPRFEVYSVDFGWGKPRKVEMASIDKSSAICLFDSPNGGVEIGLVRPRNIMEKFAKHFMEALQHL